MLRLQAVVGYGFDAFQRFHSCSYNFVAAGQYDLVRRTIECAERQYLNSNRVLGTFYMQPLRYWREKWQGRLHAHRAPLRLFGFQPPFLIAEVAATLDGSIG
jgi:hypothetical protein